MVKVISCRVKLERKNIKPAASTGIPVCQRPDLHSRFPRDFRQIRNSTLGAGALTGNGQENRNPFAVQRLSVLRHDLLDHQVSERASCTISTRTFLVSTGFLTSRKNAMRAPRTP